MDKNIYAAIAMALYEYQGNNVHDGMLSSCRSQQNHNTKT